MKKLNAVERKKRILLSKKRYYQRHIVSLRRKNRLFAAKRREKYSHEIWSMYRLFLRLANPLTKNQRKQAVIRAKRWNTANVKKYRQLMHIVLHY
jgi:hypothetical protein